MRIRYALALMAMLALVPNAIASTGYSTVLSGANEVPAVASAGTGTATVILNNAGNQLSYTITYSGLVLTGSGVTASHIHKAAAGTNGPVLFPFTPPLGTRSGTFSGTIAVTAANVADLNAGLYYVNIHSSSFPGGELRGQLGADVTPVGSTTWGRIKSLYR